MPTRGTQTQDKSGIHSKIETTQRALTRVHIATATLSMILFVVSWWLDVISFFAKMDVRS